MIINPHFLGIRVYFRMNFSFRLDKEMVAANIARRGMGRILDGIIKYRQTLRPALLEEFQKVATGPSVRNSLFRRANLISSFSPKVFS